MKRGVLAKSFFMGITYPAIIYLVTGVIEVITQEAICMAVLVLGGLCLFALPIVFLDKEKKLNEHFYSNLTAPAYLVGYAILIPALVFVTDYFDLYELCGHHSFSGISLTIMQMMIAGGFCWAAIFRVITAIINAVKKRKR